MQHSPEFKEFTLQFYCGILDDVETMDELIKSVLSPFVNPQERARLRAHLDKITQDDVDDKELQKIWWSSSADIVFRDSAELRDMLKRVRDRLSV